MTHTYQLTGMTCGSCEAKVQSALLTLKKVTFVEVSKENNQAIITTNKKIALPELQSVLEKKYQISALQQNDTGTPRKSWLATYAPVLLIFVYLFSVTTIVELIADRIDISRWMRHFMAGFFLIFSFFKMLNLKGFKDSYAMYDIIARKFPVWGYMYVCIEVLLGIAFLTNFNPVLTNSVTLIVMSVSIIGVLNAVLDKKIIQCACLGAVFKLPMSTVTIIEDGLMIAMSLGMLLMALA
jgi:copper chaperone CopZ